MPSKGIKRSSTNVSNVYNPPNQKRKKEVSTNKSHDEAFLKTEEATFEVKQHKLRAKLRVESGRASPFDHIVYLSLSDAPLTSNLDLRYPSVLLRSCSKQTLDEIRQSSQSFVYINENSNFWKTLIHFCTLITQPKDKIIPEGILQSIEEEIEGKSLAELDNLENQVEDLLTNRTEPIDEEYWIHLLSQLRFAKCRLTIDEQSNLFFDQKLENIPQNEQTLWLEKKKQAHESKEENVTIKETPTEPIIPKPSEEELWLKRQRERHLDEDEEELYRDVYLPNQPDLPKPVYFNTQISQTNWNSYTLVHFDEDNPPPKRVIAYKFSLFLPKMRGTGKVPHYVKERIDGDGDSILLKFKLQPFYPDVAFRISDIQWKKSWKDGYECSWHDGVFKLWFNLKICKYRR